MEPLRFVYSDPRMKSLLFQVGMCKTSLMKRLKTHRLLLTQLQLTVAGSSLTLPVISVPYVNNSTLPWGISLRGRGTASAANWATGHIFGICWLVPAWTLIFETYFPLRDADLHQRNFLQTWQNPNFTAPAPWHGSHRVFFGVFEGPGSHSLSKCSFRKHMEQWALMWKLLLECWEISHNVFFWPCTLRSCQILKWKNAIIFKREKGRTIGLIPEKSRFHADKMVWSKAFRYWTFSYNQTHSGLWPQPSDIEEPDFTRALLKLCNKKKTFFFLSINLTRFYDLITLQLKKKKSKQKTQNQNNTEANPQINQQKTHRPFIIMHLDIQKYSENFLLKLRNK